MADGVRHRLGRDPDTRRPRRPPAAPAARSSASTTIDGPGAAAERDACWPIAPAKPERIERRRPELAGEPADVRDDAPDVAPGSRPGAGTEPRSVGRVGWSARSRARSSLSPTAASVGPSPSWRSRRSRRRSSSRAATIRPRLRASRSTWKSRSRMTASASAIGTGSARRATVLARGERMADQDDRQRQQAERRDRREAECQGDPAHLVAARLAGPPVARDRRRQDQHDHPAGDRRLDRGPAADPVEDRSACQPRDEQPDREGQRSAPRRGPGSANR